MNVKTKLMFANKIDETVPTNYRRTFEKCWHGKILENMKC